MGPRYGLEVILLLERQSGNTVASSGSLTYLEVTNNYDSSRYICQREERLRSGVLDSPMSERHEITCFVSVATETVVA